MAYTCQYWAPGNGILALVASKFAQANVSVVEVVSGLDCGECATAS